MAATRPSTPMDTEQPDKKRLRKGTHSCWECKRRKRRCIFAGQDRQTCVGCRRYGLPCLGQEVPEAVVLARKGRSEIGEQLRRVETILQSVMDKVHGEEVAAVPGPASEAVAAAPRPMNLSETLLAAFPSPEDYQTLMGMGRVMTALAVMFNTGEEMDMLQLEREIKTAPTPPPDEAAVPSYPDASTHPVLLARQMLYWMVFLQSPWHERVCILRTSAWTLMARMAAAVRMVNGNDDLHGSLESLECMLLEAQYHRHQGNLRRSWVVNRRAMLLAQLMGVHRADGGGGGGGGGCATPPQRALDPRNRAIYQPALMWAHIVFHDRFLCLLLGLPQGSSNARTVACVPQPTAVLAKKQAALQLECALAGVAARILERNERGAASHTPAELDAELLRAAQQCPPDFWDLPPFAAMAQYSLEDTAAVCQLLVQVYYFQLLNQLHLPYMLSFIHAGATGSGSGSGSRSAASATTSVSDYAAIRCTHASREILQRFLAYRRFNHTTACFRQVDFCAVPAVLTLLLAHLDVHLAARNNRDPAAAAAAQQLPGGGIPLAHKLIANERTADRALLHQVLERLDFVSHFNRDSMSNESAQLLRSLLEIEAKAAAGAGGDGADDATVSPEAKACVVQIKITHLGLVYVAYDGRISKVMDTDAANSDNSDNGPATPNTEPEHSHWAKCINHAPEGVFADDTPSPPPLAPLSVAATAAAFPGGLVPSLTPDLTPPGFLPNLSPMPVSAPLLDPALDWGPAITAGMDNWATQGVDMAFFEHLFMDPPGQPQ